MPWSVKLQPMVLHIVPEALPKKKKKTILQRDQRARKGEGRGENGEEEGKGPAGLEPVRASWRGASVRAPAAWDLVAERMRPGVHAGTLGRVGRSCPGLGLSDKLFFFFSGGGDFQNWE